jgi:hypothetical protein
VLGIYRMPSLMLPTLADGDSVPASVTFCQHGSGWNAEAYVGRANGRSNAGVVQAASLQQPAAEPAPAAAEHTIGPFAATLKRSSGYIIAIGMTTAQGVPASGRIKQALDNAAGHDYNWHIVLIAVCCTVHRLLRHCRE